MSLHTDTLEALTSNPEVFTEEINTSIHTVLDLIDQFSAMSDTNYILYKSEISLDGIKLPGGEGSWLPIRNLARILAKIATIETDKPISNIHIESMKCGCDYFEGNLHLTIGENEFGGAYKWQWTAFPGRERNFNKFTIFPKNSQSVIVDNK